MQVFLLVWPWKDKVFFYYEAKLSGYFGLRRPRNNIILLILHCY